MLKWCLKLRLIISQIYQLKSSNLNTAILAIIACLLWSTAFVGIKIGLPFTTPLQFAGIRFFISGLMILPFTGGLIFYWKSVKANLKIVFTISLLNTFLQYSMFYIGLNMVPAALAAIIIGASPLFVALVTHFMMPGDKMSLKKLFIFFIGFGGIILVSLGRNNFSEIATISILGVILLIGVNITSGFGNVFVAKDGEKLPPLVLSASTMLIGGACLYLVSIPIEGIHPSVKPFEYYAALIWLSLLSAIAISIWFILLKRPGVKVSDLNFWKFLIPLVGAILAWIILPDEKPGWIAITGMIIIAVSLILLNIYKRRTSSVFMP